MATILAGIDEAGYGPLLGPLCVGLTVLRVNAESPSDEVAPKAPDLWKLLSTGVCREPARGGANDPKGRIAVADSKLLKLANSVKTAHPLVHLERGVLAFAASLADAAPCPDDASLFSRLGAELRGHACYDRAPRPLPVASSAGGAAIAANILRAALLRAGVDVLALRCEVQSESAFNETVRETGSKAETTARAIGRHLRLVWERWGTQGPASRLGVVCDKLGGRDAYAPLLARELSLGGSLVEVETVEESALRSRYIVRGTGPDGVPRRAGIAFLCEGEKAHLPVALASMVAKLVRELAMLRFNDHWTQVLGERPPGDAAAALRPTAGYRNDAWRWLEDAAPLLTADDRARLVRIA